MTEGTCVFEHVTGESGETSRGNACVLSIIKALVIALIILLSVYDVNIENEETYLTMTRTVLTSNFCNCTVTIKCNVLRSNSYIKICQQYKDN